MAWFMEILNFLVVPTTGQSTLKIPGNQFQLFSVSTYNNGGNFHGSALGISISPEAAEFLDKHSESTIPGAHRSMREHNHALYPDDSRQDPVFLRIDLQGVIREHGTISFKTFGNCACLGDAPEKTEKGRGKYATSHNLDRPWQQLSMLVGIATMWRWARTKLAYK